MKELLGSLELNRVYQFDVLEGMSLIPDQSVKCVVTSPPYNLGGDFHTFVGGKRVTYGDYKGKYNDKMKESDYQEWQISVLNECYRILKDDGVMFYNHKNRIVNGTVISPFDWIKYTSFNINQVIVMNLKSTANVDKRRFFPVHELIFVLTKEPGLKLNNVECLTDVWDVKKVPRKVSGHPATFHIDVPLRCIKASTEEGDVVFDPFAGTSTTLVAAKQLNRKYIGFEISSEYIELSNERLEAEFNQEDDDKLLKENK